MNRTDRLYALADAAAAGPDRGRGTGHQRRAAGERRVAVRRGRRQRGRLRHGVRGFRLPAIEASELRGEHVPARDPAILRREMDRFDARAFGAM